MTVFDILLWSSGGLLLYLLSLVVLHWRMEQRMILIHDAAFAYDLSRDSFVLACTGVILVLGFTACCMAFFLLEMLVSDLGFSFWTEQMSKLAAAVTASSRN